MVKDEPSHTSPINKEAKSNVIKDDSIFDFIFNMEGTNSSKCPTTIEYADDMHINFEAYVVYVCPACGAEFDVQDSWKRHMINSHNFNTLSGLNFLQMDRYNHECLYCHKEITAHRKENLFKHTLRHLPYRSTKCKFCLLQYKNPQDLILHLHTIHRDNVLEIIRAASENPTEFASEAKDSESNQKENATSLIETTLEGDIEVKNELIEPDANEYILPSFLDDALCRRSSRSAKPQADNSKAHPASGLSENLEGLNFQKVPSENSPHFLCLECQTPIYTKSVRKLQYHQFTHLTQAVAEKKCTTIMERETNKLTATGKKMEFSTTQKGNKSVLYQGYEYTKFRENKYGIVTWRCRSYFSTKCKAALKTQDGNVLGDLPNHCHDSNPQKAQANIVKANMKENMKVVGATPRKVIGSVLSGVSKDILKNLPKQSSLTRNLARYKEVRYISNPITAEFVVPD